MLIFIFGGATGGVHPRDSGPLPGASRPYAIQPATQTEGYLRRAFTIIELTVTLCILSILSAIAIPWAGKLLDRVRVYSAVVEIQSMFSAARHVAIARAAHATVELDTVARSIVVSVGADTVRRAEIGAAHDVSFSATRTRMSYYATGMGYGAANLSVVVRRNSSVDTVFVSRLGRVRH